MSCSVWGPAFFVGSDSQTPTILLLEAESRRFRKPRGRSGVGVH